MTQSPTRTLIHDVWFNLAAQKFLNGENSWLTSPFSAGTKAPEFFTQEGQRLGQ